MTETIFGKNALFHVLSVCHHGGGGASDIYCSQPLGGRQTENVMRVVDLSPVAAQVRLWLNQETSLTFSHVPGWVNWCNSPDEIVSRLQHLFGLTVTGSASCEEHSRLHKVLLQVYQWLRSIHALTGFSSPSPFVFQEPTRASGSVGCVMATVSGRAYRTAWRPSSSSLCEHP